MNRDEVYLLLFGFLIMIILSIFIVSPNKDSKIDNKKVKELIYKYNTEVKPKLEKLRSMTCDVSKGKSGDSVIISLTCIRDRSDTNAK
jgi:hypothetical protein